MLFAHKVDCMRTGKGNSDGNYTLTENENFSVYSTVSINTNSSIRTTCIQRLV